AGAGPGGPPVRVEGDPPSAGVHVTVVRAAQQDEVVELGRPGGPGGEVVRVAPGDLGGAPREGAPAVASLDGRSERPGRLVAVGARDRHPLTAEGEGGGVPDR